MEPLSLSFGGTRFHLDAHMTTSAAAAGGGGGGGIDGGRGGGDPYVSVDFHLITPAEVDATRSEHLRLNPPFHTFIQEVNSMIHPGSASRNFLLFAFCAFSSVAVNHFLMLSGHAALFLSAEIDMASPPRHSLRAEVETPRWLENLATLTFEGNEHGEEEKCAVCLMDFVAADELHVMPCRHRFHGVCLREWFCSHRTCPMCRFLLPLPHYTN